MVFSSIIFLFFFLPIVLGCYHLIFWPVSRGHRSAPFWRRLANLFLLLVSLIFYFWGEGWLVWIVLASTLIDYCCGLLIGGTFTLGRIEQLRENAPHTSWQRLGLIISLCSNLAFLGFFKYFNFGIDSLNTVLPPAWQFHDVVRITLPLGISFYTFQSMSYTIDVYCGRVKATSNLIDFACFVALFPQLVAGPIVRYRDVAHQLVHRTISRPLFASGVSRFTVGLAKKVLLANTVAQASDAILALPADQLTTQLAWIVTVCYSLQIYLDFSGYSDMAIGLGRMFGFQFLENFNYPYIARSIQDFWRRWHISLSSWFRDYLYIPLGGSHGSAGRTYLNLITVFFLCGLWHGANWAFVAWGLYHGAFLILERSRFGSFLKRLPRLLQHLYAVAVIMVGWVLFATESFAHSLVIIQSLLGFAPSDAALFVDEFFAADIRSAIIIGIVVSTPLWPRLKSFCQRWQASSTT
ncbi:MAG: MBOAT family O-acyltransferase, partial [Desulforhopalus sp.]